MSTSYAGSDTATAPYTVVVSYEVDRTPVRRRKPWFPSRYPDDAATEEYAPPRGAEAVFARLRQGLQMIQRDSNSTADAGAPSAFAIAWAELILAELQRLDFAPDRVMASAEGGIAICFTRDGRYADVEALNSREIVAVTSNRRDEPHVWTVSQTTEGLINTLVAIREYFRAA